VWELVGDEPWGTCVEVEGVFVDPEPPLRERFTLVGCQPAGGLAEAIADGRPTMVEEISAYREHFLCWTLHGPLVIDRTTVEGVLEIEWLPADNAGFELSGWREPYGTCLDLAGLDRESPAPPAWPLRLIGFEPMGPMVSKLRPRSRSFGQVQLRPLNRFGWPVEFAVTDVRPSRLGDDQFDVTLKHGLSEPLPRTAKPIWDLWLAGGPDTTNLWAPLDTATRLEWMRAAMFMRQPEGDREPGRTYHLDGRHVTDTSDFFCALGEAVNDPGGYFGWNADAIIDCCRGHWGARTPFTLVWHDWQVAARHLPVELPSHNRIDWVDLLREGRVTVVLD